jgi:O-antigen/teichoic acid export membrane protein
MWPAYSDALSRKDYSWLLYFFKKSLKLSLWLIFSFSFILYFISPFAIEKWTRGKIILSSNLLTGMFFWCILSSIGGSFSTLLNGLHKLRFQIGTAIFGSILNISLSILLVKKIGISGPIWGSVITLLFMYSTTWYYIVGILKEFQKERVECNEDSL